MSRGLITCRHRSHPEVRRRKAIKILAVLQNHLESDLHKLACLDVGCSTGIISDFLSEHFGAVVGVDIDTAAVERADQRGRPNASFLAADALSLPFDVETFDVVVCAQVYEHVSNPVGLLSEIRRVLRKNGVCFFSGPNKLAPIEAHYSLLFVHWLPKPLANFYLKASGEGDSYGERPLFYWQLKKLVSGFEVVDYTVEIIRDPVAYSCEEEVRPRWLSRVPKQALKAATFAFPNYNWVLRKKS